MTAPTVRRLKQIQFQLGANSFECQVSSWQIQNNTDDGDKLYTYCPDGEYISETDADYALNLQFFADWKVNGISDFLVANDGLDVAFTLDHHPDIVGEHVQWTGTCRVKAPTVGGNVRTNETGEVTLKIVGKPTFTRVA